MARRALLIPVVDGLFATGISTSGIFANFVGCWHEDILRAIAPVFVARPLILGEHLKGGQALTSQKRPAHVLARS